ncbi:AAA family ATPase [Micromonospora chalcea]
MIRRLTLKNWRSYKDFTIDLGPGTTFIVATNGVGKTSLVEAARWALFGTGGTSGNAIRVDADSATARVELELPDLRVLAIERTLARNARRRSKLDIQLDGAPIAEEDVGPHFLDAYGTEPGFLARLAMPAADRSSDTPSHLGLEAHLGRYYGVDGLGSAIEQLKKRNAVVAAEIKKIKEVNSAAAQRLDHLLQAEYTAKLRAEKANEVHQALKGRADHAREEQRRHSELAAWKSRHETWRTATERLAERTSVELGRKVPVKMLQPAIDEFLSDIDGNIEQVRVDIAVNESRETQLTSNDQDLMAAEHDCPICRRPLDGMTITSAHEANADEISRTRTVISRLRSTEADLLERRRRAREILNEYRRIPHPGREPEMLQGAHDTSTADENIEEQLEKAFAELVEARAAHKNATREREQAQAAGKAMGRLESLFRQNGVLTAAIEATEATRNELLTETIRPLASEVSQRWQALFPGRGQLVTRPDGQITRSVSGHQLTFDAFSTGEGMGATILVRLLVAHFATSVNFCWFDEPLEHLDPDVRRQVGNALSRLATGSGPLRQVVVTTYEERLARHLQARDPEHVKLLDVRQPPER